MYHTVSIQFPTDPNGITYLVGVFTSDMTAYEVRDWLEDHCPDAWTSEDTFETIDDANHFYPKRLPAALLIAQLIEAEEVVS